jgi:L-ascorbate metabolism protein UlaG (beta-lactamase superfamily)
MTADTNDSAAPLAMIEPVMKDDAFLREVESVKVNATAESLFVWWLGQSGFLVGYRGKFLLFDPYLSDSLTRKYAGTQKPHVRMTARVIDPRKLDFISVVTSTHNHTDHLDAETLLPIFAASSQTRLVLPAANVAFAAERLGSAAAQRFVPLKSGDRASVGPFTFRIVPAAHEQLSDEFAGFVITVGPYRIYHSGDTVLFPGMIEQLAPENIDLALLPINGRAPGRGVAGNLTGSEAAKLAHDIGARWVVPCHYDMFTFNTASTEEFEAECSRIGQQYAVLRAGQRWSMTPSSRPPR